MYETDPAPLFEESTSPLTLSNDGRLRIDRVRETAPRGYAVVDTTDSHVEVFTFKRKIADAYIAGYDYAQRVLAKEQPESSVDSDRIAEMATLVGELHDRAQAVVDSAYDAQTHAEDAVRSADEAQEEASRLQSDLEDAARSLRDLVSEVA